MKKLFLTLILLSILIGCNSNKTNSNEKENSLEHNEKIADSKTKHAELTELQKEEKIRTEINKLFLEESSNYPQRTDAVTDFNGKTEFWRICKTDSGNRIIRIESHEKNELYEEVYFEKNGDLIYAEESIKYMPINHYVVQPWICQFYAEQGKLISLMSLGHGKTEDEEWNPEVIFDMYKKRITELNKIAKE